MKFSIIDQNNVGDEPAFNSPILNRNDMRLAHAYNWYNYYFDPSDHRKWVKEYMKKNSYTKQDVESFDGIRDCYITNVICALSRIVNNGYEVSTEIRTILDNKIKDLISERSRKSNNEDIKKPNVQLYINEQVQDLIGDLEEILDNFIKNDYKLEFSIYEWLNRKDIKSLQTNRIKDYYSGLLQELNDVVKGDDKQLVEGYEHLSKSQLKRYITFVSSIIDDCKRWSGNQKKSKVRKPRKMRVKSTLKQTEKVKYKKENTDLKLVSCPPASIIGASRVILYNDKVRKILMLEALDGKTLQIKGTSILNYDKKQSIIKTVRKPTELLPLIIEGGKSAVKQTINNIKAKSGIARGRLSEDVLIVRVFK